MCKLNTKFTYDVFGDNVPSDSYLYLSRCAFNVFNVYEQLNKSDKKNCRKDLNKFKQFVFDNDTFNNTALKMRCYGKGFWFIYKIFEKTVGRLLKGKNE